jgi:hypothetical protein
MGEFLITVMAVMWWGYDNCTFQKHHITFSTLSQKQ